MILSFTIVLLLSLLDGFAARRGAVCLLQATVEIIDKKKPKTLLFIIECSIFAMAVGALGFLFSASTAPIFVSYMFSYTLVAGSIIYGLGVVLNGTCMIGTLNRLIAGDINYFATLLGLFCGYVIFTFFLSHFEHLGLDSGLDIVSNDDYLISYLPYIIFIVGFLLLFWRFGIFVYNYRTGNFSLWRDFLQTAQTRDFITTASIGLSSGVLFLLLSVDWSYTRWMTLWQFFASELDEKNEAVFLSNIALSGFIAGIILAVILSNKFSFVRFSFILFGYRFLGGILLGLGIGLIPGGNDTLIFYSLPSLALHALVAIMIIMLSSGIFVIMGRYFSRLWL